MCFEIVLQLSKFCKVESNRHKVQITFDSELLVFYLNNLINLINNHLKKCLSLANSCNNLASFCSCCFLGNTVRMHYSMPVAHLADWLLGLIVRVSVLTANHLQKCDLFSCHNHDFLQSHEVYIKIETVL